MKKILFALVVFTLSFATLRAQTETISYTKLAVSPDGIGSFGNVYGVGLTNAQVDSAFDYLGGHGTISGQGVWAATRLNNGNIRPPHFSAPQTATLPYRTAYIFAGGTVSGGKVQIPDSAIGSSITSISSLTGDVAAPSSITFAGTSKATIVSAAQGQTDTVTIPDPGANASFVLTAGTQTVGGAKTLSSALAVTPTTNQLVLGATRTVTISASQPASSSRIYTIPDQGAASNFLMSAAAQTVAGVTTFSAGVPITATTNQLILGGASHLLTVSSSAIAASSQTYTIPDVGGAGTIGVEPAVYVSTVPQMLAIPGGKFATIIFGADSVLTDTIAAPTAGTGDGIRMLLVSTHARAYTLRCSDGFNAKGSSGILTWTGAIGNSCWIVSYNGHWYLVPVSGVAAS